jgi:hypothetical protein
LCQRLLVINWNLRGASPHSSRKGTYMRDIAKEVYEKMRVGNSAWIKPVAAKGDTLPSFQAVHDQVKLMAEEGLISVSKIERQEDGLIDAIRIQKLA